MRSAACSARCRPTEFLPAANDYLLRQDWDEGFATAIHLSLDLDDGSFEIRTAGHPPAALRQAGTGRWAVLPSEGPVLGLMRGRGLPVARGPAASTTTRCCSTPTAWSRSRGSTSSSASTGCSGEAEHLLRGSFEGAARRLVDALGSRDDDRAMVVVSRS